jgi:hypothetical protein
MPGQVGHVFADLWQDVVHLQALWETFIDLFGTDQATLELLNEVSSLYFQLSRQAFITDIHMRLSRLTDPATSNRGKQQNISLLRLLHEIEAAGDADFAAKVRSPIDDIVERCSGVRAVRHKLLAHTDLHVALRLTTAPPGIAKADLDSVLNDAIDLMNTVEIHYRESSTIYKRALSPAAARPLLVYLRLAHESLEAGRKE